MSLIYQFGTDFSAPAERGARTASACSSLTGGEFFAEPQRGDSPSADGGSVAAPAAGAKRKGHLRFPFLFELLPFPCFLIWRRFPICDRFENRERQRIFSTVGEHSVLPCRNLYAVPDTVLLHRPESLRRRGIAVPRNSLARCNARHLRIRRLVQFIFVGAVYHNALSNCAALLSPRGLSLALRAIHLVPHPA